MVERTTRYVHTIVANELTAHTRTEYIDIVQLVYNAPRVAYVEKLGAQLRNDKKLKSIFA